MFLALKLSIRPTSDRDINSPGAWGRASVFQVSDGVTLTGKLHNDTSCVSTLTFSSLTSCLLKKSNHLQMCWKPWVTAVYSVVVCVCFLPSANLQKRPELSEAMASGVCWRSYWGNSLEILKWAPNPSRKFFLTVLFAPVSGTFPLNGWAFTFKLYSANELLRIWIMALNLFIVFVLVNASNILVYLLICSIISNISDLLHFSIKLLFTFVYFWIVDGRCSRCRLENHRDLKREQEYAYWKDFVLNYPERLCQDIFELS